MALTGGRVDASRNVEVAESVGVRHVAPAFPVVVVPALMVRQAASQREVRPVPIRRGEQ